MLSSTHKAERSTRLQADEAFFFVRRGDRPAVKDAVSETSVRAGKPDKPKREIRDGIATRLFPKIVVL